MSRSRFVLPLIVAAVTATGAADLFDRALVQGNMSHLQPPARPSALALLLDPPPGPPAPPPPPPPPAGFFP